ncbi:alpha/beta hydrolase [Polaromonas sp.]|uniref:esterase/lipase family protein n=1 Tax=Polaromonas sp. TaxID=1869339 RepID=UPI00286B5782|nr:alpha/beta hydrolase [Polaromonas sp.]
MAQVPTWLRPSDLQGLAQLATQGTLGVAGLAETVQGNVYKAVAALFGPLGAKFLDSAPGSSGVKKTGITGLAYAGVRGVTRLAGGSVNALLAAAAPRAGRQASSPEREAMLSALNGVLGDHLLATGNPLAISMCLRQGGEPLPLDKQALAARLPAASAKLLVLVHGLCMNDGQWGSGGADLNHGDLLARELGYTPVYLHYNSGLHTSSNGQQFAALLEQLWQAWPQPIEELSLLAHSMGGLVSRSACHHGEQAGHLWRKGLKNLVFLGTPYHGAPLEGLGNWLDTLLVSNVVTRPFASIGQIRSAGITDLRHGNLLDADWQGADRFERAPDVRQALPLPAGVACFALAGTTLAAASGARATAREALSQQLLGDGLVPLPSALGQHEQAGRTLAFAPDHQWIATGVNHMALLKRPEVGRQLVQWLRGRAQP